MTQLGSVPGVTVTAARGESAIGGGTTPGLTLPSVVLDVLVSGLSATSLEARLRAARPPVIARIEQDRVLLDLRTVAPGEDDRLAEILSQLGRER